MQGVSHSLKEDPLPGPPIYICVCVCIYISAYIICRTDFTICILNSWLFVLSMLCMSFSFHVHYYKINYVCHHDTLYVICYLWPLLCQDLHHKFQRILINPCYNDKLIGKMCARR